MIILGIDPGLRTLGYGLIEKKGSKHTLLHYGVILTKQTLNLSKRLFNIATELQAIIHQFQPDYMAIEELFFNKNVKSAFVVSQARGAVMLIAEQKGLQVAEYTPLQIKMAVCGYGRADKQQVQYMVKQLLNLPEIPKPVDAADALAAALTHSHTAKINSYV